MLTNVMSENGTLLRIYGKVQGVGFRPWIWQLAQRLALKGDVCNDGAGVVVRIVGDASRLLELLPIDCPPLARIDKIQQFSWHWRQLPQDFTIRHSMLAPMATQVAPDAATCQACLQEMRDPSQRRYRYPFINCTHCGPRFTIIRAMPYDRPFTVMKAFPLCAPCAAEYRDPADRRFHAQPIACADCGPHVTWFSAGEQQQKEQAIQAAIGALKKGKIIAIKGIGGFHLACDANNEMAVRCLRQRKRRPSKPFAVMITDAMARLLPEQAQTLLQLPAAPIVLVDKQLLSLVDELAPQLNEVGVMLAANPLQHLLMQAVARPLVMTSGNRNGYPPALNNEQALAELIDIADGWLLHNRDILQRMDDSVMRASGEMLRRARGFVPDSLPLPPGFSNVPPLLCLGADLKNTFCMVKGEQAVLSQHLGDLTNQHVEAQWCQVVNRMQQIWQFTPQKIVTDKHPAYRSLKLAQQMSLPIVKVQHHHAHAVACLAEHHWPRHAGDVIALILDGIGWGDNDQLWGGECLRISYDECERLAGLPAVALPGGDLAACQPWRNLLAQWLAFVPDWQMRSEAKILADKPWQPLARAIERGINSPPASSAGRLFDAVATALGCAPAQQSYQGEAACKLEALALTVSHINHPVTLPVKDNQLDMITFWQQWLDWQVADAWRAWAFHDALAKGLAELAACHAQLRKISTIVCSGGVLHNRLLRQRLQFWLTDFELLLPMQLPAGDGAIAFGQALIAAAKLA